MDYNEIRKLVRLVENADITSLKIEEGDLEIHIEKATPREVHVAVPPHVTTAPATAPSVAPAPQPAQAAAPAETAPEPVPAEEEGDNLVVVKAPMVGTFYRSPSPDVDSFVEVGDMVVPGQTLCILEAMKIMNEIECETAGRIVEIHVDNAQPVQFDQELFRIAPQ